MRLYPLAPAEPTPTTRAYPSSLSDAEWAVLQPLIQRSATPQGGRPPKHPLRQIIDAIRYLVRSGCAWRLLPRDFPPPGTVYWWFAT
jgi:transposase